MKPVSLNVFSFESGSALEALILTELYKGIFIVSKSESCKVDGNMKKGPDKAGKAAEGDKRLRKRGIKTNPHILKRLETHPNQTHPSNIAIYMDSIALRLIMYIEWKFVFFAAIRATSKHVSCNRLALAHISSIVHKSQSLFPSGLDGVKLTGQPCLHRGVKAEVIASGVMAPVGTRCRCEQSISSP